MVSAEIMKIARRRHPLLQPLLLLLLLLLSAASASDVLVGDASNFDQLVAAHEFALVEL